ncbi:MAG: hypothetical protein ABI425_04770 [Patescibacteria group bacterium]
MASMTILPTIPLLIQTTSEEILLSFIPFSNPKNHPDVIWVNPEQEALSIEVVRTLQHDVLTKPYSENYRIFVIQDLELATIESQQALLKLLEEPPQHIRLILTTQYPAMILQTILSRVQLELVDEKMSQPESADITQLLQSFSLRQKIEWAAEQTTQDNPVTSLLQLLYDQLKTLENTPTLQTIRTIRLIEQTVELLRAKTNPKLCVEWFVLHI